MPRLFCYKKRNPIFKSLFGSSNMNDFPLCFKNFEKWLGIDLVINGHGCLENLEWIVIWQEGIGSFMTVDSS